METIKSYTDIEQSDKLAEILPLESADMVYQSVEDEYGDGEWEAIPRNNSLNIGYDDDIPCWSLTALLSVLNFPSLTQNKENEWEVCCLHDNDDYIEKTASTPIDACVDMILKLYGLKRLNL